MCSLASTSVSLTVFFFSMISLLSSNCCLAFSSLALRSSSVTFLIFKFNSFSSARRCSNSYYLKISFAMSAVNWSNLSSQSSSCRRSDQSPRSFLCFFISRWLPSTSGLSYNWRQSFLVDSFKSLATFRIYSLVSWSLCLLEMPLSSPRSVISCAYFCSISRYSSMTFVISSDMDSAISSPMLFLSLSK